MPGMNKTMLVNVRATTKQFYAENARGEPKTGKEKVRQTHESFIKKADAKHAERTQQFLAEHGKGTGISKMA